MKNLPCALCWCISLYLLAVFGWSWYAFVLLVFGLLLFEYTPKKYEDLVYRKLELECEMLEKDLKRKG